MIIGKEFRKVKCGTRADLAAGHACCEDKDKKGLEKQMKRQILKALTVLLIISALTGGMAACGKKEKAQMSDGTFTVGFDAEFPPYGYKDESGEYVGF